MGRGALKTHLYGEARALALGGLIQQRVGGLYEVVLCKHLLDAAGAPRVHVEDQGRRAEEAAGKEETPH